MFRIITQYNHSTHPGKLAKGIAGIGNAKFVAVLLHQVEEVPQRRGAADAVTPTHSTAIVLAFHVSSR